MIAMLRDFAIGISIIYGLHFLMGVLSKNDVSHRNAYPYPRRRIKAKRLLAEQHHENR